MTALGIRSLSKTYPGHPTVQALRGLNLDVSSGAIAAVLGPSGCGKTTLLRVLAGLERADSGTVLVGERVVADDRSHLAPEHRRVGIVPQEGALFPHLDVAANIAYGIRRMPREERRGRIRELLALVDLVGLEARRAHELSGGQQQRVALARALAPRPDVILLDEPFSALDAALRSAMRDQVVEVLRSTNTTAVLVTHDQEEALSLADEVSVMRDGNIVQHGCPADLYHRPIDIWTAQFLGDAILLAAHRPYPDSEFVETPLGRLALDAAAPHAANTDVTVMVRPEQVVRSNGDGHPTSGDVTDADVEHVRFRGTFADVTLRIGTTSMVVRWPSTTLPAPGTPVGVVVEGAVVAFDPIPDEPEHDQPT